MITFQRSRQPPSQADFSNFSTAWTNKGIIERTIPIYCSRVTYQFVAESSPYLVDKNNSSGGGSVPSFEWHIMPEDQDWEVCGVDITPLPGKLRTLSTYEDKSRLTVSVTVHHGVYFNKAGRPPLICLGFLFDSSLLYMSDVK